MENWKAITGYEGLYEVSDMGNVRSLNRISPIGKYGKVVKLGKILKPAINKGYCRLMLFKKGKREMVFVHRLVAAAFVPNPLGKPHVNHIVPIKSKNEASNLEWVTSTGNMVHASNLGLLTKSKAA